MSMEGFDNHEQLLCKNHDFLHKQEVDPPPDFKIKKWYVLIPKCE